MGTTAAGRLFLAASVLAGSAALGGAALAGATHATAPRITALQVTGSPARPVFTITGHGLVVPPADPKVSPSNQPLCPLAISGNAGFDYGTQFALLAWDAQPADANALLYAAGRYRPALNELDCIGIVVLSHTTTTIRFTFGHAYLQYYRQKPRLLRNGDVAEVVLRGASFATVVRFR